MNDAGGLHVQQTAEDLVQHVANVIDLKVLVAGEHLVQVCIHEVHHNVSMPDAVNPRVHRPILVKVGGGENVPQPHNERGVEVP